MPDGGEDLIGCFGPAIRLLVGPGREGRAVSLIYIGVVAGLVVAVPTGTPLADAIDWRISFVMLGGLAPDRSIVDSCRKACKDGGETNASAF